MTRISFIMPTFNRSTLIAESLQAITAQADAADEILVLDDGSTDATEAVVRAQGPKVRYHRQANAGKAAALNRALAMTDGDLVWICDDDDLLRPGAVALLVAALGTSRADFVFGRHDRFRIGADGRRQTMGTGYWPDLSTGALARHVLEDAFLMQHGALVRRHCYARVGGFDERFLRSQDYEMFVRLALACDGAYVDAVVFDQRKHDGARGPATLLHAAANSEEIWQRYDRMIFEANAERLGVAAFAAMFEGTGGELVERAALLQRSCTHARHGLWPAAIADLTAAAAIRPGNALHPVERAICRRIFAGKHGFAGALEPGIAEELRRLCAGQPGSARILSAALSGLFWRLRRDAPPIRQAARALLAATAGPAGTARILAGQLIEGRGRGGIAAGLGEKHVTWLPAAPG